MLVSFQCYEVPGVKILTYNGPIYYGNRSFFREEMSRLLGLTPEKIRSWEKARKALEKREREATINTVVCLVQSLNELRQKILYTDCGVYIYCKIQLNFIVLFFPPQLFFRKEALQTHLFPQKMSSLNQVSEYFYSGLCGQY